MAELTGLNPSLAKTQINDFYEAGYTIGNDFETKYLKPFFKEMGTSWYSPKAVEFWGVHFYDMLVAMLSYSDMLNNVCVKATNAYNNLASSNGLPSISDTNFKEELNSRADWNDGSLGLTELDLYFQEVSPDGTVGMDVEKVRNVISTLKQGAKEFALKVEELPVTIAFYDPDGTLQETYKGLVRAGVAEVLKSIISMSSDMEAAIQEEANAVVTAKESAASTIAG